MGFVSAAMQASAQQCNGTACAHKAWQCQERVHENCVMQVWHTSNLRAASTVAYKSPPSESLL